MAHQFLAWLTVPAGSRWLDVGCGTGALSKVILDVASPAEVLGIDPSGEYIAYARRRLPEPRASFEIGDARSLPVRSATFDAVVTGLVLNFVPDPARAVTELARVVRAGGAVGAYVWDYTGGMEMIRRFWDAAVSLDPSARELDEGRRFASICNPDALVGLFSNAGLRKVEARAVDVPTVFDNFDDYWTPFLGGQGPAPGYIMSLSEERRADLRERIRANLPIAADGTIHLTARAWAVRGER